MSQLKLVLLGSPEEYIVYVHQQIANSRFADFLTQPTSSPVTMPVDEKP